MNLLTSYPVIITFISAELIFLLVKSSEIKITMKKKSQREKHEQRQVERGLVRSLLSEAFIFVPASATLILLIAPIAMPDKMLVMMNIDHPNFFGIYTILGITSYGFPFSMVRGLVKRAALKTLQ